jgi:hypothetical protein
LGVSEILFKSHMNKLRNHGAGQSGGHSLWHIAAALSISEAARKTAAEKMTSTCSVSGSIRPRRNHVVGVSPAN